MIHHALKLGEFLCRRHPPGEKCSGRLSPLFSSCPSQNHHQGAASLTVTVKSSLRCHLFLNNGLRYHHRHIISMPVTKQSNDLLEVFIIGGILTRLCLYIMATHYIIMTTNAVIKSTFYLKLLMMLPLDRH